LKVLKINGCPNEQAVCDAPDAAIAIAKLAAIMFPGRMDRKVTFQTSDKLRDDFRMVVD